MSYTIVGLGNPGEEYAHTRHNAGAIVLDMFARAHDALEWKMDKVKQSLISKCDLDGEKLLLIKPQAFMNKSGVALKEYAGNKKKIEKTIVIHDDLDLPLGSMKIVFNRGSGGHKGVESIKRTLKSEAFIRIRIGVCPTTPGGKLKKPDHEKLLDFIVGEFKKPELDVIKKIGKKASEAIEMIVAESLQKGMTDFN